MDWHGKRWWIWGAVLGVALVVRFGAALWWQARLPADQPFFFGDSASYVDLAQDLVRGEPYEYGEGMKIFRTPGYPALLAMVMLVAGDPAPAIAFRVLGVLLGTVAVAGAMWLGRELFDDQVAIVAGLCAALYPGAIGTSVFVLSEAPFGPLMILQLACWVRASRCTERRSVVLWAVLAGLCAGAATLMRPSWLLFTPVAALAGAFLGTPRRRHGVIGLAMLLALVLVMTPWWVRNYRVTGRCVATTLQVGASLYDGLHPGATGASDMAFVSEFVKQQREADESGAGALVSTFEYRLDQRMKSAAWQWARSHPAEVLRLAVVKIRRMWSPWPNAAEFRNPLFSWVMFVTYTPLLIAAVGGLIRYGRRGWAYVLCFLPALYSTALHALFVSSIRYREPIVLPWFVLAAAWLVWMAGYETREV